jgi:hypothetical protein
MHCPVTLLRCALVGWEEHLVNPNHTLPTASSTHRFATFVTVAICLSLAGGSTKLILHHRREVLAESHKVSKHTIQEPLANRSFFGPAIQVFELLDDVAASKHLPIIRSNEGPSPSDDSGSISSGLQSFPLPIASSGDSVRNDIFESAPDVSTPTDSTSQVPESATTAPMAQMPVAADTASVAPQASTQPSTIPQVQPPTVALVVCGSVQCPDGEVCCNASCGTCALPGELCSQQVCGMSTLPVSVSCGPNTCNVEEVCCNANCGTCARSLADCDSAQECTSPIEYPQTVSCGLNTCNVGEVCCNANCGTCARSQAECDSAQECASPVEYPESVSCGMVTCNTGLVCCNPSCGICASYGVPCSQDTCD